MGIIKNLVCAVVFAVCSSGTFAFSLERYTEGVHYTKVAGAEAKPNTVMEFFSYGCPHCYHLESDVEAWMDKKPESIQFNRVPATWNAPFQTLAQLYFALENMSELDKAHKAAFDYLHNDKKSIRSMKDALVFAKEQGLDEGVFTIAWNDKQVKSKLNESGKLFAKFKIRGVPAMVVNGQYSTSVSMAGSEKELFEIVDFLLKK